MRAHKIKTTEFAQQWAKSEDVPVRSSEDDQRKVTAADVTDTAENWKNKQKMH